jgi:ABC-type Fe3+-hydroxamate transport system substrate-binding protein
MSWLTADFESPRRIYGYGAAAKASTIMNSIGEKSKFITAIADASEEKQTRFMPPIGVPIISPEELLAKNPTDIVIFPWNIKQEISSYLGAHLHHSVRLWCLIPEMKELHLNEI